MNKNINDCLAYIEAQPPSDARDSTIEVLKALILEKDRTNRGRFYFIAMSEVEYGKYIDYLEQLLIEAKT